MDVKAELVGGDKLQEAINRAAFAASDLHIPTLADTDPAVSKNGEKTPAGVGSGAPGPGRPRGVRNKLTNLRDAVIQAFDEVGGAQYLVKLAQGTQSDRAAFTSLVAKVLPTQINQNVEGGIKLELSWLGGRSIGNTAAQLPEPRTQVLDLEQDSDGGYRIKDPNAQSAGAGGGEPASQEGAGGDERQGG